MLDLTVAKRLYIGLVERVCTLLDHVPCRDSIDGKWYRMGDWGCRFGVCLHAVRVDERWGTEVWGDA